MRLFVALALPLALIGALSLYLFAPVPLSASTPTPYSGYIPGPTPTPVPTLTPLPTPTPQFGSFSTSVYDLVSCPAVSPALRFETLNPWGVIGKVNYLVIDESFPPLGLLSYFRAYSYLAANWDSDFHLSRNFSIRVLSSGTYSHTVYVASYGNARCSVTRGQRSWVVDSGASVSDGYSQHYMAQESINVSFALVRNVNKGSGRCFYRFEVFPVWVHSPYSPDCYCVGVGSCNIFTTSAGLAYSIWGSTPVITPSVLFTYCTAAEVYAVSQPGWVYVSTPSCGPGIITFPTSVYFLDYGYAGSSFSINTSTLLLRYSPITPTAIYLYCPSVNSHFYSTNDLSLWSPAARRYVHRVGTQGVLTAHLLSRQNFCISNFWNREEWWVPVGVATPTVTPTLDLTVTLPVTWWDVFSDCLDIPPYYEDLEEIVDEDIPSLSLCLNFRAFRMAMPVSSDVNYYFDFFLAALFMGVFAFAFYMAFRGFR